MNPKPLQKQTKGQHLINECMLAARSATIKWARHSLTCVRFHLETSARSETTHVRVCVCVSHGSYRCGPRAEPVEKRDREKESQVGDT